MRVTVEPASVADLAPISALAAFIWHAHYPGIISGEQIEYMLARMYDVEVMRSELESGIAYDRLLVDGTLRGFCSYGPTSNAGELKVHKLYIHSHCQRQGLGALLLDHIAEAARKRDFSTLILAVNKKNNPAVAAYRKHGFTIRESIVADIGAGFVMDDYVMAKKL